MSARRVENALVSFDEAQWTVLIGLKWDAVQAQQRSAGRTLLVQLGALSHCLSTINVTHYWPSQSTYPWTTPLRFTNPIYHQKCTDRLISRLKMYCQKCRTPLRLDSSLEDLNPAAYDLLVGESRLPGPSRASSSLHTLFVYSSIVASHCETSCLFKTNECSRSS